MAKRKKKSRNVLGMLFANRTRRRITGAVAGVLLLLGVHGFLELVPYDRVPEKYQPVYLRVLAWRNSAVARSGIPWDFYESRQTIATAGGAVELYWAPSPSIDERLVETINGATKSIDMAIYDLDLSNVIRALADAHGRGIAVRIITDTDNLYLSELEPLKLAGVPIKGDDRSAIMHNKFVIIDGRRLWTGSFNFTHNGAAKNDNNALLLDAPLLAANYQAEFDEMWAGQFGPMSPAATPNPRLLFSDMGVDCFFAPEDGVMERVIDAVNGAESSIDLMAFSFTSEPLALAIRSRADAGVAVRCLFDGRQAENAYSQDEYLASHGIDVKISANSRGVMHHKVIVIDKRFVVTGSFNFSKNADESNDENVLILDSPALAAAYDEEFTRCWLGMKGY